MAVAGVSRRMLVTGCFLSLLVGLAIGAFVLGPLVTKPSQVREVLIITGSTTCLPVIEACARRYMELHPEADIRVSGGGSGVGIANLVDGVCDIAMASRQPKPEEIKAANASGVNMILHAFALDAVCVIVHPCIEEALGEPLKLGIKEVRKIFVGEWTYWDQVDPRLPHELSLIHI